MPHSFSLFIVSDSLQTEYLSLHPREKGGGGQAEGERVADREREREGGEREGERERGGQSDND